MAYCEAGDVMDMLKEDAMNPIIGDRYIEDPQNAGRCWSPWPVRPSGMRMRR